MARAKPRSASACATCHPTRRLPLPVTRATRGLEGGMFGLLLVVCPMPLADRELSASNWCCHSNRLRLWKYAARYGSFSTCLPPRRRRYWPTRPHHFPEDRLMRTAVALLLIFSGIARAEDPPEQLLPATAQLYLRWDGIDAHKDAYRKTALGKMLAGDTGTFINE